MTTPVFTPRPGLIGLTQVVGGVGIGIEIGQFLNGEGFRKWEHAFVTLPGGLILEAEPGGARIVPFHYTDVYWCHGLYKLLPPNTTDTEIAHVGESLKGVQYSFLDYDALFVHRLHIPVPGLQKYIADSGHQICSQMADEFYLRLRVHLFLDGRWPGYVTPMSLYNRDQELVRAA
jgi:hypothetical protein